MKVTAVASTVVHQIPEGIEWEAVDGRPNSLVTDADSLSEFAGRGCYKSWHKPNPGTATNGDYLANILRQGHESVFEHSSVSFYVEHVSRALLVELERHRFLSFSVESQRYVDQAKSHPEPVIPPALRGNPELVEDLRAEYFRDMATYRAYVNQLEAQGLKRKEAREAARAILPNATPVDFLVSGNLRAWRDVIRKRFHVAADAEIREFAGLILANLRVIAPYVMRDIPEYPYGS
ncbi:FAD-dependent thymidylate synthase [Streptomyces cellulosae]